MCGLALSNTLCNKYNITEYGRSCLPCTALPYSHTAARPRWVTPFYVLRYFLRVGTLRAQDSKCHSRHFFTPKLRSRNAGHFPVRSQNFQKNGLHLLHPISITPLSSELEWGYAYWMQIDKSIFFLKIMLAFLQMCIFCCTFVP